MDEQKIETKQEQPKEVSPAEIKSQIKLLRREKHQAEGFLNLKEREMDTIKSIHEFELNNSNLIEDKLAYVTMQEYHDLVVEHKKVLMEFKYIELKDQISRLGSQIHGSDKMIAELDRQVAGKKE